MKNFNLTSENVRNFYEAKLKMKMVTNDVCNKVFKIDINMFNQDITKIRVYIDITAIVMNKESSKVMKSLNETFEECVFIEYQDIFENELEHIVTLENDGKCYIELICSTKFIVEEFINNEHPSLLVTDVDLQTVHVSDMSCEPGEHIYVISIRDTETNEVDFELFNTDNRDFQSKFSYFEYSKQQETGHKYDINLEGTLNTNRVWIKLYFGNICVLHDVVGHIFTIKENEPIVQFYTDNNGIKHRYTRKLKDYIDSEGMLRNTADFLKDMILIDFVDEFVTDEQEYFYYVDIALSIFKRDFLVPFINSLNIIQCKNLKARMFQMSSIKALYDYEESHPFKYTIDLLSQNPISIFTYNTLLDMIHKRINVLEKEQTQSVKLTIVPVMEEEHTEPVRKPRRKSNKPQKYYKRKGTYDWYSEEIIHVQESAHIEVDVSLYALDHGGSYCVPEIKMPQEGKPFYGWSGITL